MPHSVGSLNTADICAVGAFVYTQSVYTAARPGGVLCMP